MKKVLCIGKWLKGRWEIQSASPKEEPKPLRFDAEGTLLDEQE